MSQEPTIGRIVHYKLSAADAATSKGWPSKAQSSMGPIDEPEGAVFPMIVTAVTPQEDDTFVVDGQVFVYGNDQLAVQAAKQGSEPGQWDWPPVVNKGR